MKLGGTDISGPHYRENFGKQPNYKMAAIIQVYWL